MGGFQKFPIPRRIRRDFWTYNLNYRKACLHVAMQAFLCAVGSFNFFSLSYYDFT